MKNNNPSVSNGSPRIQGTYYKISSVYVSPSVRKLITKTTMKKYKVYIDQRISGWTSVSAINEEEAKNLVETLLQDNILVNWQKDGDIYTTAEEEVD